MIGDYLETLARDARASGLESERLVDEAADHLRQAASAFEAMGYTRHEACMRAIADFGDPRTIVMSTSTNLGGFMRSKIRALALAIGVVATVTLWVGHVAPSQENTHTLFELMLVAAVATMGATTVLLLASIHQIAAVIAAPVAAISVWAIAAEAAGEVGLRVGGVNYIWALVGVAVLVIAVCHLLRVRGAVGIGLLISGVIGLVLNGAWEPTGALGDGQGNIPVLLLTIGWGWIALSVSVGSWAHQQAARLCALIATWLIGIARRLASGLPL
jgi:hypothetical protein